MSRSPEVTSTQHTYFSATHALKHLAPYDMIEVSDYALPEWDRSHVRRFELSEQVADTANMGQTVRLTVQGNTDWGVALILKPRNIFSRQRYGFFIQPEGEGAFSVWHGRAKTDGKLSWVGAQALEYDKAVKAEPKLANALISDLVNNAGEEDLLVDDIG